LSYAGKNRAALAKLDCETTPDRHRPQRACPRDAFGSNPILANNTDEGSVPSSDAGKA